MPTFPEVALHIVPQGDSHAGKPVPNVSALLAGIIAARMVLHQRPRRQLPQLINSVTQSQTAGNQFGQQPGSTESPYSGYPSQPNAADSANYANYGNQPTTPVIATLPPTPMTGGPLFASPRSTSKCSSESR